MLPGLGIRATTETATLPWGKDPSSGGPHQEARLQRFFSTFPSGLPGLGLVLLRLTLGAGLIGRGVLSFGERAEAGLTPWGLDVLGIPLGAALLVGFLTPALATVAVLTNLGTATMRIALGHTGTLEGELSRLLLAAIAAALALLGPGAFSVDARLFGRREIVVPRSKAVPPRE